MFRELLVVGLLLAACADDEAPCVVSDDRSCSHGCSPVVSAPSGELPCAVSGRFFGCARAPEGEVGNGVTSVCARLEEVDEDAIYCFAGPTAIAWYYDNAALFCDDCDSVDCDP